MYKSASTSQFQNTFEVHKTFFGFQNTSNQMKPSFTHKKNKKLGVQFKIQDDKENNNFQFTSFETQKHKSTQKPTKSWHQHSMTSKKQINQQNDLFPGFTDRLNSNNQKFNNPRSKFTNFSSKKIVFQQSPYKDECKAYRTMQKSRSMKSLSHFEKTLQFSQQRFQSKKSQRKFQNFTAFDGLLKQSQNLMQKYKTLDQQKTRLKTDLKNQIEFKSKSSKKIVLLEERQAEKNFESSLNGSKFTDYSSKRKTFSTFKNDKSQRSDVSFQSKENEFKNQKISNHKFEQKNSPFSTKSSFAPKYDFNSCSYDGSFGLYKSSSTKKLSPTGLSLQDFQLGKVLGSGAFGQVYPAVHKKTGWIFALKKIKKSSVKHMLDQFVQEIKIQLFLDHPNIVKLYSFFDDDLHFYILMEYMEGGSLYSQLKKKKALTLQETSQKLQQVCVGLQHMHDNSVIHRDIKPQNIVLSHNVAKLCDFGWSAICKGRRTTYCGTLDYVCPQIIEGEDYDDSVDIWSLGVLAYELLVGKTPFYNISRKETMKKIVDVIFLIMKCNLEYPSTVPQIAINFISNILKKNPQQRQSIQQILKDPLLKISQNKNLSI